MPRRYQTSSHFSHYLESNKYVPAGPLHPGNQNESCPRNAEDARKHLDTDPTAGSCQDRTVDRVRRQSSDGVRQEGDSRSEPNLLERGDGCHQRRNQRHVRARAETEQHGESNQRAIRVRRDPERQHPDTGQVADHHEDVVLSNLVTKNAREDTSKQRSSVEDSDKVLRQVRAHACLEGLHLDVVDRDKDAVCEEKETNDDANELELLERAQEHLLGDLLRTWGVVRADRQVGNDEQPQNHEGAGAHGPGISDLLDEPRDHDREDDAADGGAGREKAESGAALDVEPAVDRVHRGLEDGGDTNGRADSLGEEDLVVLGCEGGHHEAEHVENCAAENEPSRAVVVVECANDRALWSPSQRTKQCKRHERVKDLPWPS